MLLEASIEKSLTNLHCSFSFNLSCDKCGVFGPSGNGKSTLMHMIAGLMKPDKGVIKLNNKVLFDSAAGINLPPEQRQIGVVFQNALLFPHMNVRKNLFYGLKRTPAAERTISPEKLISMLRLEPLLDRKVARLSGGERQRVALGRTILGHPQLILLDEPLSGLDSTLKYEIIPELREVFAKFSIPLIFISHSIQEMRMMTEETLIVKNGQIDDHLTTEELARTSLGSGGKGYTNLLWLDAPEDMGNLLRYHWGETPVLLLKTDHYKDGQFGLNSRDILLFKRHPEAASARNMLECTIRKTYETDWLWGVELDCQGNTLIAEIVPQSLDELDIAPGNSVVAVFKASAFEKLW